MDLTTLRIDAILLSFEFHNLKTLGLFDTPKNSSNQNLNLKLNSLPKYVNHLFLHMALLFCKVKNECVLLQSFPLLEKF